MITYLKSHRAKLTVFSLATIAAIFVGFASTPPNATTTWDWLENTTWYVKPQDLPAMAYDTDSDQALPTLDQTVYHIRTCRSGYFVGETTIQFAASPVQCRRLIGTVTPEGALLLTFIEVDPATGDVLSSINAPGMMRRVQGQWTMENQMSAQSSQNPNIFTAHWAYMHRITPNNPHWNSLPFAQMSVPDFMAQCE